MAATPTAIDPASREAEARSEIAATRVGRGVAWTLVAFPLALLAAALALEASALVRDDSRIFAPLAAGDSTGSGLRQRNRALLAAAREIEDRFDEGSAIARELRPWGQLGLTAGLGYGNEETYVGREGFLVYRADFDHLTARGGLAALGSGDPIATTASFARDLAARGIALVVLPVPVKPTIEPRRFASGELEAPLRGERDAAYAGAIEFGGPPLHLFDPAEQLAALSGRAPVYLDRDTHWRPQAMDDVARELALRLRAIADLPIGDPERLVESPRSVDGVGDGVNLLALPAAFPFYARERVTSLPVETAEGEPWRATAHAPVLLLGDSFSAIYSRPELGFGAGAGFAERLSFHLGLPVDRILENAGGASATRETLARELERDPGRLDGVRAVVWQFAARELTSGDWHTTPLPQAQKPPPSAAPDAQSEREAAERPTTSP